ncbi:chloroplast ATP synthase subunit II [Coccomyxa subellipsoidea C-169]|uniref:Chloroplast ATP synthase subunit II n=1 Tax=Coccomyxa subellipsoidea (strain C-169) TaxID=574566 RepID=I0YZH5_COCSC|nr:chloroplast ATP synthase subunit II [Coccomyxa subellipsoidea C-169]EIE23794.1 chloroplast ATP synthase subunit II [Coccomyxa subellipsoidea C-169]|eukprot:XP_005648338.1 chloroplast ATP synthase subunit II [Coccomyxa subellipsoidea C-169]
MIAHPACRPLAGTARSSQAAQGRAIQLVVRAAAPKAEGVPQLPAFVRPAALAAITNALMALPAHAVAGKIFDFNLTLPIMVGQFLLLMVFLDKTWFTPVGKVLDERDGYIREQLKKFKGNDDEILSKQQAAEKVLQEARAAAQKQIQEAKAEATAKSEKRLGEVKAKIDKELASALAVLDKEKKAALSDLDSQVDRLAADVLARVLPEGVKL